MKSFFCFSCGEIEDSEQYLEISRLLLLVCESASQAGVAWKQIWLSAFLAISRCLRRTQSCGADIVPTQAPSMTCLNALIFW